MADRADEHATMLANRLRKNARRLGRWARRERVSCYRLYDRDIPEVPLVVDWYDGRLHVSEYLRNATRALPAEEHDRWLETLVRAAANALGVELHSVFVKRRDRQRGRDQYGPVARQRARFVVTEGDLGFWVNLSDYVDTGLFLDHRPTRALVRELSRGRAVLNLFAYTGAFTVHAAAGGARQTTSVDLSRTYLDWARDNLELNGHDSRGPRHRLVRSDVERFLALESEAGRRYDLVVLDPPTFSNSKSTERHLDVQRDHAGLVRAALALTAPGGSVLFSTNARRFRLAPELASEAETEDLTEATVPPDFRDRRVHRCYRLRQRGR